MTGNKKKTPATTSRKRVTASARARTSVRKVKTVNQDLSGSYIKAPRKPVTISHDEVTSTDPQQSSNFEILTYLKKIENSNHELMKRVDSLESRSISSTPRSSRSHTVEASVTQGRHITSRGDALADLNHPMHITHPTAVASGTSLQVPMGGASHRDAVLPGLDALRHNPTISQAVTGVLASYEDKLQAEATQGKSSRKSGRFNTTDTVTAIPERRWANEGYHGRRKVAFDDLTLPEWAAGQLSNVLQMQDQSTAKNALLQVILALKDAASLPWATVRSAWAISMHEVEQGTLSWHDSMQWSINRLSSSQISLVNSQVLPQHQQQKRICKYFNDGQCSHDANHGNYKHVCSYCARQGRNLNHQEIKCNFKQRGQDKSVSR